MFWVLTKHSQRHHVPTYMTLRLYDCIATMSEAYECCPLSLTPSVRLSIPQHIISASAYNNLLHCVFISSEELFIPDIFNACTHNQTHAQAPVWHRASSSWYLTLSTYIMWLMAKRCNPKHFFFKQSVWVRHILKACSCWADCENKLYSPEPQNSADWFWLFRASYCHVHGESL